MPRNTFSSITSKFSNSLRKAIPSYMQIYVVMDGVQIAHQGVDQMRELPLWI